MDNGIGNNDVATLSLLGGGYNGIGLGRRDYGTDVLAAGTLADGTALKSSIDCHSAQFEAGLDRVSAQGKETRDVLKEDQILKGQSDLENRVNDRNRDVEKLIIEGQKEAAKCCCDAQLAAQKNACDTQRLIIEKSAATDALILAVEGRANLDKLAEARAENTYLKTIQELGHNHHSVR